MLFFEKPWPLAQRSRMMDYKDLRGAKALSARLMPELEENTRMSAVTRWVGGVQVMAIYSRDGSSCCRVERSRGTEICVQAARARREFTDATPGHMTVPIKLSRG